MVLPGRRQLHEYGKDNKQPYIDYTNLPAGTYTFYFVTICGGGTSQSIVYDDIIVT